MKEKTNGKDTGIDVMEILCNQLKAFDTIDMLCVGINQKLNEINEDNPNTPTIQVPLSVLGQLTTYIKDECNFALMSLRSKALE